MYFICKLTFILEVKTSNLYSHAFLLLILGTLFSRVFFLCQTEKRSDF